jgi:peptidyl-prolyl cis-trans isomerase B (cyclophilin B)
LVVAQVVLQGPPRAPLGVPEPLAVLNAERAWSNADALWLLLNDKETPDRQRASNSEERANIRRYAVRAIGRVEDPSQVRRLLALKDVPSFAIFEAVAQSLYGFDPKNDPRLIAEVAAALGTAVKIPPPTRDESMAKAASLGKAMSHIAFATEEQVSGIESLFRDGLSYSLTSVKFEGFYRAIVRHFEALARVNSRLAHFDDDTIALLEKAARGETIHGDDPDGRRYAFMALVNARALTPDVERKALKDDDWTLRRAAAAVLAGGGGGLDEEARLAEIRNALDDSNPHVRYDALRAWGRHGARTQGCQPILDALKDNDQHVVLQAFDLLGTACLDDDAITKRLEAETAIPQGADWPRPTHAFVALAKRSPEKSAIHMEAFTTHPVWWVRMYAAFATAGAKDLLRLDRLAYDDNDNVREAAIPHLRLLDPERAERAMLAALERTDIQLIHTVAGLIKEAAVSPRWVTPLVNSLDRLTRLRSMTSRDGRVALLDAIERHARAEDQTQLLRWLRDFDPTVATRAAEAISRLSGSPATAQPTAAPHLPTQPFPDLRQCVVVNMSPGKPFRMRMAPLAAPIAVEQFLRLATIERYYNGLTIHRVAPNFVIQGGSPGANEYSGYKEFLRDEVGASNVRGSVGLSIRGRNTGDAQFYVNLVDNPRLDGGYTVFAHVFGDDMEVVDRIQEGDVMRSIDSVPCGEPPRRR